MTANRTPSVALTRFVVASRYMPVYIALVLLIIVASIWVPETLSRVALSAIAPFAGLLAITALGQMLVIARRAPNGAMADNATGLSVSGTQIAATMTRRIRAR